MVISTEKIDKRVLEFSELLNLGYALTNLMGATQNALFVFDAYVKAGTLVVAEDDPDLARDIVNFRLQVDEMMESAGRLIRRLADALKARQDYLLSNNIIDSPIIQ